LVDSDDGENILEDSGNTLEDSGSDYEEEAKKEKAKRKVFVGSDSESEDESKKQNRKPETSTVSPIPKQIQQYGKKGQKTQQKVILSWPRGLNQDQTRQHTGNPILAESVDDLPCAHDDKDLNTVPM